MIFVLSYVALQDFFDSAPALDYFVVDNGNQKYTSTIPHKLFSTNKNIGCAGGWNLICSIAFEHLGLEKIIITQDDCTILPDQIEQALQECTPTNIVGIIQPFFEFSCFAIHADTYKKIGVFDENFINVYCEDADYKQRCYLNDVQISSLYVPNKDLNKSISVQRDPKVNSIARNKEYLKAKWGESIHPSGYARADQQPPYAYKTPFNEPGISSDFIPTTKSLQEIKGTYKLLPSRLQFERYKLHGFSNVTGVRDS